MTSPSCIQHQNSPDRGSPKKDPRTSSLHVVSSNLTYTVLGPTVSSFFDHAHCRNAFVFPRSQNGRMGLIPRAFHGFRLCDFFCFAFVTLDYDSRQSI